MRNNNKNKRKTPSPHLSLFRRINFIPSFLYLLPQQCRWMGNKGWHQFVKCCLCCRLLKVRALHTPLLIHCGVFHGVQVDLCSSMDLQSLEDHILHHHGLHHELQGNLCSGTWTTSSYPFSPTLVSAVLFFCSPIVSLPAAAALFEKKICCPREATTFIDALASGRSILGLAGIIFMGHRAASGRSHPCSPSLLSTPSLCFQNLAMQNPYTIMGS